MSDIFVSYSSADRDLIKSMAGDLADFGHRVWFDREISGGHEWWNDILDQIRQCDLFIFALTPHALASHPCRLEYTYAFALNKRILPLLLADVDMRLLPHELSKIQFVDYRHPENRDSVKALGRALSNLPAPQPLPEPLPKPPEAPVQTFDKLADRVTKSELPLSEQTALVFEIKALLKDPSSATTARTLLETLRKHPDLRAGIAEEIDTLLGTSSAQGHSEPPRPAARPTSSFSEQARPVQAPGSYRLAGIDQRFGALLIDGVLLTVASAIVLYIVGTAIIGSAGNYDPFVGYTTDYAALYDSAVTSIQLVSWTLIALIMLGYMGFFLSRNGQTVGMKLLKIRVVKIDGGSLSFGGACLRGIGQVVSTIPLGLGYLLAFADSHKQTLHDKIAGTIVVAV